MVMSEPERRPFPRFRFRVPCGLSINAELTGSGFVVDASASGLLLQTRLSAEVGDPVEVEIRLDDDSVCKVAGTVVRRTRSHRDVQAVAQSTLALEIEEAAEAFYQLLMRHSAEAS